MQSNYLDDNEELVQFLGSIVLYLTIKTQVLIMSLRLFYIAIPPIFISLAACSSGDNPPNTTAATTAPAIPTIVQSNYLDDNEELDSDFYQAVQIGYVKGEGK